MIFSNSNHFSYYLIRFFSPGIGVQSLHIFSHFFPSYSIFLSAWKKGLADTNPAGTTTRDTSHTDGTPEGQKVKSRVRRGGSKSTSNLYRFKGKLNLHIFQVKEKRVQSGGDLH